MGSRILGAVTLVSLVLVACTTAEPELGEPSPPLVEPEASPSAAPVPSPSPSPSPSPDVSPEPSPSPDAGPPAVALLDVGRSFDQPVHVFGHAGRSHVVEQPGRVVDLDDGSVWLDLRDEVLAGGERGLLGVAVHPEGGHVVVHHTGADGDTVLATYRLADGTPDVATRTEVFRLAQPAANHNGGTVAFGPDGMLWLALGDGGGAEDRFGNGQDPDTALGTLVRLDLDDPDEAVVPPDNAFVDGGGAPEVHVWGLRNPYRIAFDATQVYVADVGQDTQEEVTVLTLAEAAGANLGWPRVEGTHCRSDCDDPTLEPADVVYRHADTDGCAVIGGQVYAGTALPSLVGHFVYSDLCAGFLRTLRAVDGAVVEELDLSEQVGSVGGVTGIGADADGELVLTFGDGRVLRLVPA